MIWQIHMAEIGLHWWACNVKADLVIRHKLFKIACTMAADCTTKLQVKLRLNDLLLSGSQLIRLCMLRLILLQKASHVCVHTILQGTNSNHLACIGREPSIRLSDLQIQHSVNFQSIHFAAIDLLLSRCCPGFPLCCWGIQQERSLQRLTGKQLACQEHRYKASVASVLHLQYAIHLTIVVLFLQTWASKPSVPLVCHWIREIVIAAHPKFCQCINFFDRLWYYGSS